MKRKTIYETAIYIDFDDDIDQVLTDLKIAVEQAKQRGYFDLEFEDAGIGLLGKRYETDAEFAKRQSSLEFREKMKLDEDKRTYERLKQKFEPTN